MQCPFCHTEIPDGTITCPSCRRNLPSVNSNIGANPSRKTTSTFKPIETAADYDSYMATHGSSQTNSTVAMNVSQVNSPTISTSPKVQRVALNQPVRQMAGDNKMTQRIAGNKMTQQIGGNKMTQQMGFNNNPLLLKGIFANKPMMIGFVALACVIIAVIVWMLIWFSEPASVPFE